MSADKETLIEAVTAARDAAIVDMLRDGDDQSQPWWPDPPIDDDDADSFAEQAETFLRFHKLLKELKAETASEPGA